MTNTLTTAQLDQLYAFRGDLLTPQVPLLLAGTNWRRGLVLRLSASFLLIIAASALDGTLGNLNSFQPWSDFQRLIGRDVSDSPAAFPLLRDYPSMLLVTFAMLTLVIVPWQWRLLRSAIPHAVEQGSITPKFNGGKVDLLAVHAAKINSQIRRFSRPAFHIAYLAIAAILTASIIIGSRRSGQLFEILVPDSLKGDARRDWLEETYNAWWAGTTNKFGVSVYAILMIATFYAVIVQNIGGYFAVVYIWGLKHSAEMRERELAPDGRAGWSMMARAYRTVYFSLSIHGTVIAIIVVVMGVEPGWVSSTVMIYLAAFMSYLLLPRLVFREAILHDRANRASELSGLAYQLEAGQTPLGVPERQSIAWLRDEIKLLESEPIAPLASTRARVVAIFITVVTVSLTLVQTWLAWNAS